jgi:hypothetical protein
MTKDAEARVRDELLQTLYSHILRCRLASAQVAPQSSYAAAADALAAGLAVSLRREDLLLLPAKDFESFRTMLGLPPQGNVIPQRLQSSGIQPQARGEAAAVAQALGAACAAAQGEAGRLVLCFPAHGYQGRQRGCQPHGRQQAYMRLGWRFHCSSSQTRLQRRAVLLSIGRFPGLRRCILRSLWTGRTPWRFIGSALNASGEPGQVMDRAILKLFHFFCVGAHL